MINVTHGLQWSLDFNDSQKKLQRKIMIHKAKKKEEKEKRKEKEEKKKKKDLIFF